MIRNTFSFIPDIGEKTEDNQFLPSGYPVGRRTLLPKDIYSQPELAIHDTVNAHIDGLKQHVDDYLNLLRSELGGQIELLRSDTNNLQSEKQHKQRKRWAIDDGTKHVLAKH
ncbi:hypothetical protein ACFLXT_01830 [Chloroflexota bacterium]